MTRPGPDGRRWARLGAWTNRRTCWRYPRRRTRSSCATCARSSRSPTTSASAAPPSGYSSRTQRVELTLAGEALLARARALLADLDDAISLTRSVGGELAGRMALLWEPWARASADVADLDGIRAALEELHGQ